MSGNLDARRADNPPGARRSRLKNVVLWTALSILAWLAVQAGLTLRYTLPRNNPRAEVAIVLGAAVIDDKPSPVFAARLDHAIDLYKREFVRKIILTGGYGEGDRRAESEAGANYALDRGVPAKHIATETVSHTTKENLIEANRLMGEHGWKTCIIVSDPLHMRRAMAMADDLGMNAKASPTPTSAYQSFSTQFRFLLRELYFQHHYWLLGE